MTEEKDTLESSIENLDESESDIRDEESIVDDEKIAEFIHKKSISLYQTLENYLLIDYRVDEHLQDLESAEQSMKNQPVTDGNKMLQKHIKKIRKLKTFMNQYKIVCGHFLQRVKTKYSSLGELTIQIKADTASKRRSEYEEELELRLDDLHAAFHHKFVPEYILPFIRKSLLKQAKQNIERDKLYQTAISTTEELLILYQLKHGADPNFRLSHQYIQENSDRKLSTYKKDVEDTFNMLENKESK